MAVKLSRPVAITIFWLKLVGIPLLIMSFAHPIAGVWSALTDIFMNSTVAASTKTLIGILYLIAFFVVGFAAYKNIGRWGLLVLILAAIAIVWYLQDHGYVSFDSGRDFGWVGVLFWIVFAWVGVFGATMYRVATGRIATDSEDPDTNDA